VELPAECDPSDEGCGVTMDNVELSGVSQKGPFVSGTDVTAYELENGKSLKQTGKTFGGKIENKDGSFNIRTVKLKSSYAYLVADGFYRNEVTGRNSSATIKLRALTNLDGRSTANINLVTHLEYDRVQRLVTKDNKSVIEAKRAAEKSLFAAFNIDNTGFKGFAEDLNIFKEGDGNAALLAVSAMLQGDRNESELTALLAAFSVDLGDNGVWDDSLRRAQIADWAMKADIDGRLATIRANVEGWKLSTSKAPAFEGHVTNFWTTELGVPACTADGAGKLFATKNVNSAYYAKNDSAFTTGDSSLVRLICDASGEIPAWRFATDFEKDTAAFTGATEGLAKRGSIDTLNIYVYEDDNWRRGTELDLSLATACVKSITNSTTYYAGNSDTTWYICVSGKKILDNDTVYSFWRLAKESEADTAQFGIPVVAKDSVKRGNVNRNHIFVYENNEWRRGTVHDLDPNLKPCIKDSVGVVRQAAGTQSNLEGWYKCAAQEIVYDDGEIVNSAWRTATDKEINSYDSLNTTHWSGAIDGSVRQSELGKYYVYDSLDAKWNLETSSLDHLYDLGGCTKALSEFEIEKREDITLEWAGGTFSNCEISDNVSTAWTNVPVGEYYCYVGYPKGIVKQGSDGAYYLCIDRMWRKASEDRIATYNKRLNLLPDSLRISYEFEEKIYYAEADTFRRENASEEWTRVNFNLKQRCGESDSTVSIIASNGTRWLCKKGVYEWDDNFDYKYQLLTDVEGNDYNPKYSAVAIGNQVWVAQNLKHIPVMLQREWEGETWEEPGSYCGDEAMCDSVVGAYYYRDVMENACGYVHEMRPGKPIYGTYHLPSTAEWRQLLSFVKDQNKVGQALKSTANWSANMGTDAYAFAVQPVGVMGEIEIIPSYEKNYEVSKFGVSAIYYTADDSIVVFDVSNNVSIKYYRFLDAFNNYLPDDAFLVNTLLPVRCVSDLTFPLPPKKL